jgi:serine/threonine protein kinase
VLLELLEGGTLDTLPAEVDLAKRLDLMVQIGRALCYLHGQNPVVIHRDVKPGNILLDRHHLVTKLSDFGLARSVATVVGTQTANIGTPAYCPPEMFDGECSQPAKNDVYGFAMT